MIKIDHYKCNLCGLCIKICHEYCLYIENDILRVDYNYCSTCTQCIAICPRKAVTWDNNEPESFESVLYPGSSQVAELFKERRTIRDYKNRKIEKSLLKEITEIALFAPTHNFNLRAVIIDDDEIIAGIDSLIYKFSVNIYRRFYRPGLMHMFIRIFARKFEFEYLKARPKLESIQKRKTGFKTKPAAIILIIGEKRIPLSLESGQYALYNIDLYAQSKGLACRNLVGNQMILNRNRKFRRLVGIDRGEKIFGALTVGYPAVRFKNKVTGKKIDIKWNSA
jgi:nitroreductase